MPIGLYETRTMMEAIRQMLPVHTFLRDTFFGITKTFETSALDVDFKKGKRKMAPFVANRVGGVTMDRQGFVTKTYKVPRIAPQRAMTIDDISSRRMGEAIYSQRTPQERQDELLGEDLAELDEMITRREEWMCRELILNGKINMKGVVDDRTNKTVDQVVDFNFTNKEILTSTDKWDQSTAKIYDDLKRWRQDIIKKTGMAPNIAVLASPIVEKITTNETMQKYFDIQRLNIGTLQPTVINPAITFIGKIASLGLELYTYDEWFLDDNDVEQPMIPDGNVILGRKSMGKRLYGAVTQMENGRFITYEGERIPKNWADNNNDIYMVRVASRPLPVPDNVDGWQVAQVY